jgi:hypothetical protein
MRRVTWIGVATAGLAVAAMAVDHLIGTEDDGDDGTFADPWVFLATSAGVLLLTALLFRFVVRSDDRQRAPTKAIACGLLAVLSLPLLFLAVPFPFAGAAVALELIGREQTARARRSRHRARGGRTRARSRRLYIRTARLRLPARSSIV